MVFCDKDDKPLFDLTPSNLMMEMSVRFGWNGIPHQKGPGISLSVGKFTHHSTVQYRTLPYPDMYFFLNRFFFTKRYLVPVRYQYGTRTVSNRKLRPMKTYNKYTSTSQSSYLGLYIRTYYREQKLRKKEILVIGYTQRYRRD